MRSSVLSDASDIETFFAYGEIQAAQGGVRINRGNTALGIAAGTLLGTALAVCTLPEPALIVGPISMGLLGGMIGKFATRIAGAYEQGRAACIGAMLQSAPTR